MHYKNGCTPHNYAFFKLSLSTHVAIASGYPLLLKFLRNLKKYSRG